MPPTPDGAHATDSWFTDETALVAELRRARLSLDSTPFIPGYASLKELQRGGQGIIYTATQSSTRRTVAVKVLHPTALDSATARRRFEREVELAATLRHEGIVRVYDSGITADGRLFLSMELIEGETLDKAAAALKGDPKALALLLARVCDALNHAHQRGVIHRDLKPSNIRVDADGTPRILDFGLARRESGPEVTSSGSFLGSLPWASPEQASGHHDQIDIRSDIYSMGVLLFQLLTGQFPYDVSGPLRSTLDTITTAEPTPLRRLRPDAGEDLEVIIAKCLAKDPAARYQTAAELAQDLRLFAAGQPIGARRESAWNAMARRLHRVRVFAWSATIILLIAAGALFAVVRTANQAAHDRDEARLATTRAQSTLTFLTNMLSSIDPNTPGSGKDIKVADVLDRAAATVDRDAAGDLSTLAALHSVIGKTYAALGLIEPAQKHLDRAAQVLASAPEFGPDHVRTLEARADAADEMLSKSLNEQAEPILREIVAKLKGRVPDTDAAYRSIRNDLGACLRYQNKLDEAEKVYRAALADSPTPPDEAALTLSNNLASLLHAKGDLDAAQEMYQRTLDGRLALSGPDHSSTLTLQGNLAKLMMDRGQFAAAEPIIRASFDSSVRIRGADHPDTLTTENNLAFAIENQKRYDEALPMWRDVVERRERVLGPDHAHTLISLSNLAALLDRTGHTEEAEKLAKEALERRQRTLGDKHIDTIIAINNLAQQTLNHGRPADAEPLFRRAVDLSAPDQGVLTAGHWIHAVFQTNLANCLEKEGKREEAEPICKEALDVLVAKLGEEHPNTKKAKATLDRIQHPTPPPAP
jgi:tetratricopeptide (TPR) repeat protein/tRNA A-37 threonylcarbamoyl transferase component Bud32